MHWKARQPGEEGTMGRAVRALGSQVVYGGPVTTLF